jgi:uncharacterized protein YkwD
MLPDDDMPIEVSIFREGSTDREPRVVAGNSFTVNIAGMHELTASSGDAVTRTQILVIDLKAMADESLDLVNAEREAAGLYPLERNEQLDNAAKMRVHEIAEHFSHTRPDERSFATAFVEAEVQVGRWGENLATGQKTARDVVDDWMESRPHREAMLSPDYSSTGISAFMDGNGKVFWVQTFRG